MLPPVPFTVQFDLAAGGLAPNRDTPGPWISKFLSPSWISPLGAPAELVSSCALTMERSFPPYPLCRAGNENPPQRNFRAFIGLRRSPEKEGLCVTAEGGNGL